MSGIVVGGHVHDVSGLAITNFLENANAHLDKSDYTKRKTTWVRGIVLHTTSGESNSQVLPGKGPDRKVDWKNLHYWTVSKDKKGDATHAGAHFIVDTDGSILCCADLLTESAYHAGAVNDCTIGIEIGQSYEPGASNPSKRIATTFESQLDDVVILVDAITRIMGIQRQIHFPYHGNATPVPRMNAGGKDVVGIYCHRDETSKRGREDPGDRIVQKLIDAGYKPFDFANNEDLNFWKPIQTYLNSSLAGKLPVPLIVDGVAGQGTTNALKLSGNRYGMQWSRPGDI